MYGKFLWRYCTNRTHVMHLSPRGESNGKCVILIHGLLHRAIMMRSIGNFLTGHGYEVFLYDYQTTRMTIPEHGVVLRKFLVNLAKERQNETFDLIVHSMGGMISRWAFGNPLADPALTSYRKLLMLGTPNQGSPRADFYLKATPFLEKGIRSLSGLSAKTNAWSDVPVPENLVVATLAGKFDRLVSEESSHFPKEVDHIVLPVSHCGMLFSEQVFAQILYFLVHSRLNHAGMSDLPR